MHSCENIILFFLKKTGRVDVEYLKSYYLNFITNLLKYSSHFASKASSDILGWLLNGRAVTPSRQHIHYYVSLYDCFNDKQINISLSLMVGHILRNWTNCASLPNRTKAKRQHK